MEIKVDKDKLARLVCEEIAEFAASPCCESSVVICQFTDLHGNECEVSIVVTDEGDSSAVDKFKCVDVKA